ncbi:UNVERIFIED_CONTAM: hypothetical protein ABIC26_001675 [Paenibacillus sp. PvR008]
MPLLLAVLTRVVSVLLGKELAVAIFELTCCWIENFAEQFALQVELFAFPD